MRMFRVAVLSLFFVGCQSAPAAPCPDTQAAVEAVAAAHQEVVRLTVHAVPAGGTGMVAVASTLADKLGKASDPEDVRAVQTGAVQVLDEAGAVDYTVPVKPVDGKFTAAVGVTLKAGGDQQAQMAHAKAIAAEVAARMK
ncbi:MAG: hypothetical protein RL398_3578 [Planctomycetota bacterium]